MSIVKNINTTLSFVLEVCGIIILGYWGFTFPSNKVVQTMLGIALPLLLITIWWIWCAPASAHRLNGMVLIFCESFLVFHYCFLPN